jgi:hypothetical protein
MYGAPVTSSRLSQPTKVSGIVVFLEEYGFTAVTSLNNMSRDIG